MRHNDPRKKFARQVIRGVGTAAKALTVATGAARNVKYVMGLVNAELKVSDDGDSFSPSTSWDVRALAPMAQGDDQNQRNGNSVLMKSLQLKIAITQHASATETHGRLVILRTKQQEPDAAPTVLEVFGANTIETFSNPDYMHRYQILKDFSFKLSTALYKNKYIDWYHKFPGNGLHQRYNGTAATDIDQNGLYVLFISDQATNSPTVQVNSRVRYYDN